MKQEDLQELIKFWESEEKRHFSMAYHLMFHIQSWLCTFGGMPEEFKPSIARLLQTASQHKVKSDESN